MKVSRSKLKLAMARVCMDSSDLEKSAELPRPTLNNAISGKGVRPSTLGKIARALNCDPADLIEEVKD